MPEFNFGLDPLYLGKTISDGYAPLYIENHIFDSFTEVGWLLS